MAAGTKLQLVFDVEGENTTTTMSFNYAKPGATEEGVLNLIRVIIANKTLWQRQPAAIKSAKTITTSENEYDVSGLDVSSPSTLQLSPDMVKKTEVVREWKRQS